MGVGRRWWWGGGGGEWNDLEVDATGDVPMQRSKPYLQPAAAGDTYFPSCVFRLGEEQCQSSKTKKSSSGEDGTQRQENTTD